MCFNLRYETNRDRDLTAHVNRIYKELLIVDGRLQNPLSFIVIVGGADFY